MRWETEACRRGIEAYHKAQARLEAGETKPVQALLRRAVPPVAQAIQAAQDAALASLEVAGRPEPHHVVIGLLDPEVMAVITVTGLLSSVRLLENDTSHMVPVVTVAKSISELIRLQIEYDQFLEGDEANVKAVERLERRLGHISARSWRAYRKRLQAERLAPWTDDVRLSLGSALVDIATTAVPSLFMRSNIMRAGKTTGMFGLTEAAIQVANDVEARAEVARPVRLPMLIEPNPWTYEEIT